jgi:diguanylate cyclase (GGDEF)-like protein
MRVLVVEDDELYRTVLMSTLARWGYEIIAVDSGEAALERLAGDDPPTLVILDWMMPGLSGPEVCKRLRACPGPRYTYLLLLTARHKTEDMVEGLEAGADDYLTKPFEPSELRARLRTAERILDLQEKLLESRRELEVLATHDPLTQLWNRRAILEHLSREAARAQREQTSLSVLLADVDRFKEVNDSRGHLVGDRVLCEVARRMSAALRPYDLLGRFGGEEFLVTLTTTAPEAAAVVAERLRATVAASLFSAGGAEFPLSISVGVATAASGAPGDSETLLHAADAALYCAKNGGRNRVCVAPADWESLPAPAAARTGGTSPSDSPS